MPTANINNDANPDRSNISFYGGPYAAPEPPTTYQIYGDDFVIGGTGTYHIEIGRIWIIFGQLTNLNAPTSLKLLGGEAGGAIGLVSTSFLATRVFYANSDNYERFTEPEVYRQIWQIDFAVNQDVEGGKKYQFFVDSPLGIITLGGVPSGYVSTSLHLSNAALSGSTQEGADNYVLLLTMNSGVPKTVQIVDTASGVFGKSVDANIQIYGSQVAPLPATLWLLGPTLLGLAGLRRLRKS